MMNSGLYEFKVYDYQELANSENYLINDIFIDSCSSVIKKIFHLSTKNNLILIKCQFNI